MMLENPSKEQEVARIITATNPATTKVIMLFIHKFGKKSEDNFEQFIKELEDNPVQTIGNYMFFVDECTQSGKLHLVMKTILRNAIFIGLLNTFIEAG
jgi:type I restriction enzyme R subunit